MSNSPETLKQKDSFIDFSGLITKIPMTKGKIICLIVAVILPFICSTISLPGAGEKAGIALGICLSVIVAMFGGVVSCGPAGAILCFLGIVTGTLQAQTLTGSVGAGLFFQFVGLCTVGYGIESTPFGSRLAYWLLKKFGKKPRNVVIILLVATAVLSSVISNFATLVLMSTITHRLMQEIGVQPGKSKFGAACMLAVVAGAATGGMGFIQGSIGVNMYSLNAIANSTAGGFTITAAQWAPIGWITLLLLLPCMAVIYLKCVKFTDKDVNLPDSAYFQQKLNDLGRIGGSEIRWLIMMIVLVVLMIKGINTLCLMLIFSFLAVCPGIGVTNTRDAFTKAIPWEVVFSCATLAMLGSILHANGVSTWLGNLLAPVLTSVSPLLMMILLAAGAALMTNVCIGGTYPTIAVFISCMAPVVETMGYNPAIILMPAIITISFTICVYAQSTVYTNYSYGYYDSKEPVLPGVLTCIAGVLISSLVCYFLAPVLWGTPLVL